MRLTLARILSPMIDVVEHSTVLAIGTNFMADHWTNGVVICVVIFYVAVHAFVAKVR